MTLSQNSRIMTYKELWRKLTDVYDEREAKAVARLVFEEEFGLSLVDLMTGGDETLTTAQQKRLEAMSARLVAGEPVQYVLGRAYFCGRRFHVEKGVLIPRPETEELCRLVVASVAESDGERAGQGLSDAEVLDVGTGSGCIAVTLALAGAALTAWDVSERALAVARMNAARLGAQVEFVRQDALCPPADIARWDAVVSNPPYIADEEREAMHRNVVDYEPHEALFVPDDNPLVFYRAIARYAARALRSNGQLFFEINPLFARQMEEMLAGEGFSRVEILRDQQGKERMARASV